MYQIELEGLGTKTDWCLRGVLHTVIHTRNEVPHLYKYGRYSSAKVKMQAATLSQPKLGRKSFPLKIFSIQLLLYIVSFVRRGCTRHMLLSSTIQITLWKDLEMWQEKLFLYLVKLAKNCHVVSSLSFSDEKKIHVTAVVVTEIAQGK